ncbi:hypothetical protein NEMIN01_1264 [Nematocida minor]|uniref:uncharacterized protein n=1 Tax=Nematocida minor TaxID=1912983 RepID=UPI00221FBFB4|nr:uncharacterized protein NEMIN01_1264 [Nematocida minor]KAI5190862.1 hypothetical protein NEMIN01_1264 [Nematocida minor]
MVTCIAYFDSISFKRYAPGKSEVFSYFLSTICICGGFVYILRAFISHEKLLSLFFAIMLHKKIVSMVFLIYMWLTAYDLCKTAVSREELTFGTAGKCICVARKKLIFYLITSIMLFIVILTLFTLKADMHFGKLLSRLLVEEDYYVNTL